MLTITLRAAILSWQDPRVDHPCLNRAGGKASTTSRPSHTAGGNCVRSWQSGNMKGAGCRLSSTLSESPVNFSRIYRISPMLNGIFRVLVQRVSADTAVAAS